MRILLLGRWDRAGNLVIEGSHQVTAGDQATIARLVEKQDNTLYDAWSCDFDVGRHVDAVQRAYAEFAEVEGVRLIDGVGHCHLPR